MPRQDAAADAAAVSTPDAPSSSNRSAAASPRHQQQTPHLQQQQHHRKQQHGGSPHTSPRPGRAATPTGYAAAAGRLQSQASDPLQQQQPHSLTPAGSSHLGSSHLKDKGGGGHSRSPSCDLLKRPEWIAHFTNASRNGFGSPEPVQLPLPSSATKGTLTARSTPTPMPKEDGARDPCRPSWDACFAHARAGGAPHALGSCSSLASSSHAAASLHAEGSWATARSCASACKSSLGGGAESFVIAFGSRVSDGPAGRTQQRRPSSVAGDRGKHAAAGALRSPQQQRQQQGPGGGSGGGDGAVGKRQSHSTAAGERQCRHPPHHIRQQSAASWISVCDRWNDGDDDDGGEQQLPTLSLRQQQQLRSMTHPAEYGDLDFEGNMELMLADCCSRLELLEGGALRLLMLARQVRGRECREEGEEGGERGLLAAGAAAVNEEAAAVAVAN